MRVKKKRKRHGKSKAAPKLKKQLFSSKEKLFQKLEARATGGDYCKGRERCQCIWLKTTIRKG